MKLLTRVYSFISGMVLHYFSEISFEIGLQGIDLDYLLETHPNLFYVLCVSAEDIY